MNYTRTAQRATMIGLAAVLALAAATASSQAGLIKAQPVAEARRVAQTQAAAVSKTGVSESAADASASTATVARPTSLTSDGSGSCGPHRLQPVGSTADARTAFEREGTAADRPQRTGADRAA